ncbi:MAG: hypothetical protein R3336_02115 [Phycisphaeraceae bacterium]|nr:hypothetical protein [Phycisphaeraceae bacterium]
MSTELRNIAEQSRYPIEAFFFVQEGLDFTVRRVHGDPTPQDQPGDRHIDGHTLCLGLRDFALQQYGLMAGCVLRRWCIRDCVDFGHIVFEMVDAGMMQKTADDQIADFEDVFDFDVAFDSPLQLS